MSIPRKVIATFNYEIPAIDKGYANQTLYVNLADHTINSKPVTDQMKDIFIGGRGFGLYYLWRAVTGDTKWNDPENEIIISSGPIGGITQYPGAGKSLVVTLSPTTGSVIDSNVGGYFGPYLKFSGWDAIEIQGKAAKDVVIYIDGDTGTVSIEEVTLEDVNSHMLADQLTELYAGSDNNKKNVSVVSAGIGADNSLWGVLNFSFYDLRRKSVRLKQAGRGGTGTVFRNKKIRALVVKYSGLKGYSNNPADKERICQTGIKMHREIATLDDKQNKMRRKGTAHLAPIMREYDLIPTLNFKFGSHPEAYKVTDGWIDRFTHTGTDGCWYGCTLGCAKVVEKYELKTGPYKGRKVLVDGPEYETIAGLGTNLGIFDDDYVLEGNFYCDTYGIDTISFGTGTAFIMECYEKGIINKDITGGLELNFGNAEAAMELLHQIARGEGFGKIAGLGIRRMKRLFAAKYQADPEFLQDIGMEVKGLEYSEYVTKESLAQQGGYGLGNKGAHHDEAWLIFMDMVLNQIPTFEDKAEALHYFPMLRTWFGLNGLCKLPWNDIVPADNADTEEPEKVPEHIENYVDLFSGVTGREITKDGLKSQSEAIYNFQRVFNLKMGYGTREHDAVPYRSVGPVTVEEYESRADRYDQQLKDNMGFDPAGKTTAEKIKALRQYKEEQYEKLADAVYKRRGWTMNGIPTLETLKRLRIDFPDVIEVVKEHLSA
ncbi:aldehyde:ferredoxin oxidoreductase [Desulfotomaculum arcticum]|uniref:Aldehyde:ferredoxin oxidoreductase n=1 Tax=Desulfotruncus arcticus DSM 17038 TaxID=1121424 RepID=A0A1I2WPX2_9FIRM|nr:aldehyde ferredoxin oxidoreductase C-terminal domain-containing protein [Desulfotruncus arcticus]SFH02737.1 aldehyde:ferredoxin oxidoreductase [Desulfotomaculum arcticum] [Desulfotruncus arcticus DSM 17038]